MESTRGDYSKALEELAEIQRKALEAHTALAALAENVVTAQHNSTTEAEVTLEEA